MLTRDKRWCHYDIIDHNRSYWLDLDKNEFPKLCGKLQKITTTKNREIGASFLSPRADQTTRSLEYENQQ